MPVSEALKTEIRGRIREAEYGERGRVVEEIMEETGWSRAKVYRLADPTAGEKKSPREPDVAPEIIDKVAAVKVESGKMGVKKRFITTEDAIQILEQTGQIEEGTVSASTVDRRLRQRGFNKKRGYERHEDEYVNQVHHIDFSRPEYFDAGLSSEGEEIIRVDGRKGSWDYKNKPKEERKRLWVMGYIDSFSRAYLVRYFIATGETLAMGTAALEFVWQRKDEVHPLVHTPKVLKFDQGSIGKFLHHHKTFSRDTGIRIELAGSKKERYADHQSQGKIERPFRTLWQKFELKLSYILDQKGITEISLEELNSLAHNYCVKLLERKHPLRQQTRGELYRAGVRVREQNVLTTSVWDLLFKAVTRKVGADRMVSYKGQYFRAPGDYRRQRIYVIESTDGRITGQDLERHSSFELEPFEADQARGSRSHAETYAEHIEKNPLELDGSKLRLVTSKEKPVQPLTLPALEEEVAPETPFDAQPVAQPFGTWGQAKVEICEVFGCKWTALDQSTRDMFERMFATESLNRTVVEDIYQTRAS